MFATMALPIAGADARADADRFAAALEAELGDLLRFCRFLCRAEEEARDLVQEVALRALRRREEFQGDSLRPYLFRIAANAHKNRRRFAFVRRFTGSMDAPGPNDSPPLSERLAGRDTPADESLEAGQARGQALAALERVPEPFRTALALRELHDLSYAEIAETLGVEIGTVRSRIARGREALREEYFKTPETKP